MDLKAEVEHLKASLKKSEQIRTGGRYPLG
jgi:hypothetical protein